MPVPRQFQIATLTGLVLALFLVNADALAADGSPALLVAFGMNRIQPMQSIVLGMPDTFPTPLILPPDPFSSSATGSLRMLLSHDIIKTTSNFGVGAVVTVQGRLVTFGIGSLSGTDASTNQTLDAVVVDVGVGVRVVDVASIDLATVALLDNDTVLAFGRNHLWLGESQATGILGSSDPLRWGGTPQQIQFNAAFPPGEFDENARQPWRLACASSICAVVMKDQRHVSLWGFPNTSITVAPTPEPIAVDLSGVDQGCFPLQDIVGGHSIFFLRCFNGSYAAFGGINMNNSSGLPINTATHGFTPAIVPGTVNLGLITLSCGDYYCIGINEDGDSFGWGSTSNFTLGNVTDGLGVKPLGLTTDGTPFKAKEVLCIQGQNFFMDFQSRIWRLGVSLVAPYTPSNQLELLDDIIGLPHLYSIKTFNGTMATASTVFFIATPPPSSPSECSGTPPSTGNFSCIDGVWTSFQFNEPVDGAVTVTVPILIVGDVGLSNTSTLIVDGENIGSGTTLINVTGCIVVNGTVVINLTTEQLESLTTGSRMGLWTSRCSPSPSSTNLLLSYSDPCKDVTVQGEETGSGGRQTLTLVFVVGESKCQTPTKGSSNTWWIILVSVIGGVLLLVLLFALLATFNQSVKAAVRPFWLRNRTE